QNAIARRLSSGTSTRRPHPRSPERGPNQNPARDPLPTVVTQERVQKVLARCGFGSRRACEALIVEGRVRVDGSVASLGDRVEVETARVEVDGHRVNLDPNMRYYAFNKPAGVVTTLRDPQGRSDLRAFLPPGPRVFPVG